MLSRAVPLFQSLSGKIVISEPIWRRLQSKIMNEIALKTPTKGSTSPTAVFMTPPRNYPCTSNGSASSSHCKKRKSLSFSATPPRSCCTSTRNKRSSERRESRPFSTPTCRKHTLASPLTPKGQVRANAPPRLESQSNLPERSFPFLVPLKTIRAGFDQSGETTGRRRLALAPLPSHTFRPVEVSESDFPLLPRREGFLFTPQVQGPKRTLPFLYFMCKESINETRPVSLKMLSSRRRPSLLCIDR